MTEPGEKKPEKAKPARKKKPVVKGGSIFPKKEKSYQVLRGEGKVKPDRNATVGKKAREVIKEIDKLPKKGKSVDDDEGEINEKELKRQERKAAAGDAFDLDKTIEPTVFSEKQLTFKGFVGKLVDSLGKTNPLVANIKVEKIAFAIFLALPASKAGTQAQFAKEWDVSQDTLSIWKLDTDVQRIRGKVMRFFLQEKTPNVLEAVYEQATVEGNVAAQKLWFQYVEEWSEKLALDATLGGNFVVNLEGGTSPFIQPEKDL